MKKQYVISERAHLMCPNMEFGICGKINAEYDESKLRSSLKVLEKCHPFLHSTIAREGDTGRLYYDTSSLKAVELIVKDDFSQMLNDYSDVISGGWNVFKEGLLKLIVYPDKEDFQVLLIAHHLLCDGRGLIKLLEEFADLYVEGKNPALAEERLMQRVEDLPSGSKLSLINKLIIEHVNKGWLKEDHNLSYENYLMFEREFLKNNKVDYEVSTAEGEELNSIVRQCRENKVSVNDYLVAKMMVEEDVSKVVIAADIRNQLRCYKEGALGNYATAMGIEVRKKNRDLMVMAKEVRSQVMNKMKDNSKLMMVLACYFEMVPELIDVMAISTLGDFKSKAGSFVGGKMFGYKTRDGYSITNLGRVNSSSLIEAMFIPPASPANKVTVGVLTVNGKMKLCRACSE